MKKWSILMLIFLIPLVYGADFGFDNPTIPHLNADDVTTVTSSSNGTINGSDYIRTDGTSTTTAMIPFAGGLYSYDTSIFYDDVYHERETFTYFGNAADFYLKYSFTDGEFKLAHDSLGEILAVNDSNGYSTFPYPVSLISGAWIDDEGQLVLGGDDISNGKFSISVVDDTAYFYASPSYGIDPVTKLRVSNANFSVDADMDVCISGGNCLSDISGGDNSSWNQSYANTLYYSISNPNNYYNFTTLPASGDGTGGWTNTSTVTTTTLDATIQKSGNPTFTINSTNANSPSLTLLRVGSASTDWRIENNAGSLYFRKSANDGSTWDSLIRMNYDGGLIIDSANYPVLDISRTTPATNGLYATARFLRRTTGTAQDGIGAGLYFAAEDDVGTDSFAGFLGGRLSDVSNGSEVGEVVLAPSWMSEDPYQRLDIRLSATGTGTGNSILHVAGETNLSKNVAIGNNITFSNGGKIGTYNSTCVAIWSPSGTAHTFC